MNIHVQCMSYNWHQTVVDLARTYYQYSTTLAATAVLYSCITLVQVSTGNTATGVPVPIQLQWHRQVPGTTGTAVLLDLVSSQQLEDPSYWYRQIQSYMYSCTCSWGSLLDLVGSSALFRYRQHSCVVRVQLWLANYRQQYSCSSSYSCTAVPIEYIAVVRYRHFSSLCTGISRTAVPMGPYQIYLCIVCTSTVAQILLVA